MAIHDTGRMAVSVGADKTLQLWDLSKGNRMVKLDLPETPQGVMWAPGCKQFAVTLQSCVQVHSGATGDVVATLPHSSKPTCAVYTAESVLVSGSADSNLRVWNTAAGALLRVVTSGHTRRIKSLNWLDAGLFDMEAPAADGTPAAVGARRDLTVGNSDLTTSALELAKRKHKEINSGVAVAPDSGSGILVTVCSDGLVKLWDLGELTQGASDTSALVAAAADNTSALGWSMQKTSWGQVVTELVQAVAVAPLATLWGAHGSRVTCSAVGRITRTATAASMTDVAREAVAAVGGVLPPSVKKVKGPKKHPQKQQAPAAAAKGGKGGNAALRKGPKATVRMSIKKTRAAAVAAAPAQVQAPPAPVTRPPPTAGKKRPRADSPARGPSAPPPRSAPKRAATTAQQSQGGKGEVTRAPKARKQKGKFARMAPVRSAAVPHAAATAVVQAAKPAGAGKKGSGKAPPAASVGGGVVSFLSAKEGRSLMRASKKKQKNRVKRAERQADRLGTE